mgnify:CR=1 FL=1
MPKSYAIHQQFLVEIKYPSINSPIPSALFPLPNMTRKESWKANTEHQHQHPQIMSRFYMPAGARVKLSGVPIDLFFFSWRTCIVRSTERWNSKAFENIRSWRAERCIKRTGDEQNRCGAWVVLSLYSESATQWLTTEVSDGEIKLDHRFPSYRVEYKYLETNNKVSDLQ